jgi:CheY-like chemotaxis protein/anti-sigma regulatory factor (Ser/Thr protein kinase)
MAMKVLVVDDHESNRILVKYLLESEGHASIEAEDGQVAVEQFIKHQPDFVLLDVVMPNMDGYEAAALIKKHAGERHVPIIFLTAKHDEASLLKCLESGGDDYLSKPINGIILKAKIKAHARTQELTQQVQAKKVELSLLHANLRQEHELGNQVLNHTLSRSLYNCPNVKSYLSSMSTFNGDLFLLAEKPSGGLYVFLGDFTGHGLAAAIGTVPISQAFFSMCEKNVPIMEIAASMNQSLKSFLPEHMFCAATLIHLTESGDKAMIWAGGLPEAYIVREGEGVVNSVSSMNMPLGILGPSDFNNDVEVYDLRLNDKLILFTDGLLEGAGQGSQQMFGENRVLSVLNHGQASCFDDLLETYHEFTLGADQQDDITLVELLAKPYHNTNRVDLEPLATLPWQVCVDLCPEQMRLQADPVAEVIKILPAGLFLYDRADLIRSILSELYSNAIEHGLLQLSSIIKDTAEGFAQYYQERATRLASLDKGCIKIRLDFDCARHNKELLICVEDSGNGFDASVHQEDLAENCKPWGRGVALVRTLCSVVEHTKNGRCVEAYFSLTLNGKREKYPQAGLA